MNENGAGATDLGSLEGPQRRRPAGGSDRHLRPCQSELDRQPPHDHDRQRVWAYCGELDPARYASATPPLASA